jgi:leucyl-tRNA---protein transferase
MGGDALTLNTSQDVPILLDESPCPYSKDGRISTLAFVYPGWEGHDDFHEYLARGYRRLGHLFYHNVCRECSACLPIRLETERFRLSRSQKRTLQMNEDVRVVIHRQSLVTSQKLSLYRKYLHSKHAENAYGPDYDYETHLAVIHYGFAYAVEMDYYLGGRLIGVGIVDEGRDALSSNYFYYDIDYLERRPGIFSILKEIALARFMGKKYYYLGFYTGKTGKMSYKKFFRPNQIYEKGKWRAFME